MADEIHAFPDRFGVVVRRGGATPQPRSQALWSVRAKSLERGWRLRCYYVNGMCLIIIFWDNLAIDMSFEYIISAEMTETDTDKIFE